MSTGSAETSSRETSASNGSIGKAGTADGSVRSASASSAPAISGAPVQVSQRQARQVAEEARESGWSRPSFAKELYLGRFGWSLIHPHPRQDPVDAAPGEAFLAKLPPG